MTMKQMRVPKRKIGITDASYRQVEWPQLLSVLLNVLTNPTNSQISTDNLYNVVYRICTAGLMVKCYEDLRQSVASYLDRMHDSLIALPAANFLPTLAESMTNYKLASQKICVIFQYLERQYVTKQLKINLMEQLEKDFQTHVIRSSVIHTKLKELLPITLPGIVPYFNNREIRLTPSIVQQLVVGLYHFEPEYATYNTYLFSLYIPRLTPDKGLENERTYTQEYLKQHLQSTTPKGQINKKRKYRQWGRS